MQKHSMQALLAFQNLLLESGQEARDRALASDGITEVKAAYLVPLVWVKCIEKTSNQIVIGHGLQVIVIICKMDMVLVNLVEFIKVDIAGVLSTITINKALSSQIFALDLRCLSDILCNFLTEGSDLTLHRSIKVASLDSSASFHAYFSLTEELII